MYVCMCISSFIYTHTLAEECKNEFSPLHLAATQTNPGFQKVCEKRCLTGRVGMVGWVGLGWWVAVEQRPSGLGTGTGTGAGQDRAGKLSEADPV